MAKQAAKFDVVALAKTLDRFTFICRFVARMTQRKDGREPVNGLEVREVRGGFVWGFHSLPYDGIPVDAARTFDMIRRLPLNYYVRQAEDLRIEAHAA
jgi:hypothetical protein